MKNPNLYDTLEEAARRLFQTVVMYDGEPYYVMDITDHKGDGIYRVYLWPTKENISKAKASGKYPPISNQLYHSEAQGHALDKWMDENKESPVVRKMANSPLFNKFRPFSLGMINDDGSAYYLARSPERRVQQGLIAQMIDSWEVGRRSQASRRYGGSLYSPSFYDCIKGNHPSARECLENLLDPSVVNETAAFDRNLAFIRGPIDTLFLQYKTEVVGFVPRDPANPRVELARRFGHLREVIGESGHFHGVSVRPK
jgi:hypothetical protein